jgi:hypothetical protein
MPSTGNVPFKKAGLFLLILIFVGANFFLFYARVTKVTPLMAVGMELKLQKNEAYPAIVPLLPWENQSLSPSRICAPSSGIPQYCCLGSFSRGGAVIYEPSVCNYSASIYKKVQDYTMAYLDQMYPPVDDGGSCDVCRIVDQLILNNLTLAFVGDSLTRQTGAGLHCTLLRRGYEVTLIKKAPYEQRPNCTGWRHCINNINRLEVRAPNSNRTTCISEYGLYRPQRKKIDNNTQIKEEIVANNDIIVFDHGLHWPTTQRKEFENDMAEYMEAYKNSNLTLVAWRETSAQHFNSSGGYYKTRTGEKCVPMRTGQEGFRMPLMKNASEAVGFSWRNAMDSDFMHQPVERHELVFLPYRNYTVPLHYFHPTECTHYCHTPFVWLPIWRSLRLAIDRVVKNKPIL